MENRIRFFESPIRSQNGITDLTSGVQLNILAPLEDEHHQSGVFLTAEKIKNNSPLKAQTLFVRPQLRYNSQAEGLSFTSAFYKSSHLAVGSSSSLLSIDKGNHSPINSRFGYNVPLGNEVKTRSFLNVNYHESLTPKNEETANTSNAKSLSVFRENSGDSLASSHFEKKLKRRRLSQCNTPSTQIIEEMPSIRVHSPALDSIDETMKDNNNKGESCDRLLMPSIISLNPQSRLLDPALKATFFSRNPETGQWDYSHFEPTECSQGVTAKDVAHFFKALDKATQKYYDESFSVTSFLKALCFGVPALALIIVGMILVMSEWSNFGTAWTTRLTVGVTLTIAGGITMILAAFCGFSAYEVRKAERKYKKALEEVVRQQNIEQAFKQIEWRVDFDNDIIQLKYD